jgi:hypothetical protein
MALELSGSINISGSMTATTILISSPGAAGMVSSSAQIGELSPLMQSTASINNLTGSLITTSSNNVIAIDGLNTYTASLNLKTGSLATTGSNIFYGTQTISGSISASGMIDSNGLTLTKNNFTINTQGSISYHDVVGLTLKGKSAAVFDFSYYNPQGNAVITNAVNSNDISFNTGSVTIGTGNLKFNTAGQGIDFSANSNAAGMTSELLNDYEEGTFTPTFAGTTSQSGQVYGTQSGTYTKVGRLVTFQANIVLSTLGTITGYVKINGLPFTALATPSIKPATTIAYNTTITTIPVSDVYGGNNFMYLYKQSQTNPTTTTQLSQGDLTDTTNWCIAGFYYTA